MLPGRKDHVYARGNTVPWYEEQKHNANLRSVVEWTIRCVYWLELVSWG